MWQNIMHLITAFEQIQVVLKNIIDYRKFPSVYSLLDGVVSCLKLHHAYWAFRQACEISTP